MYAASQDMRPPAEVAASEVWNVTRNFPPVLFESQNKNGFDIEKTT